MIFIQSSICPDFRWEITVVMLYKGINWSCFRDKPTCIYWWYWSWISKPCQDQVHDWEYMCIKNISAHRGLMNPIWRQRSGSTLAQVMACCLTAPSHYLNQCWLIIRKVQWYSSEDNLTSHISAINHWNKLENYSYKIPFKSATGQWLIPHNWPHPTYLWASMKGMDPYSAMLVFTSYSNTSRLYRR